MCPTDKLDSVTVAIPTRDRTTLLAEAIESVLAQTRQVDRLVVVDNSQKIATEVEALCRSYGGRVDYLPPVRNLSLSENHQRALTAIKSPLGCVMQDDDVYAPTFIERGIEALMANPEASLFAVNYSVFDASGQLRDRAWPDFPAGTLSSREFLEYAIEFMSPVHLSASMFRLDAFAPAAFYDVDTNCSDMGLFFRIACAGPVILVDEPLSNIREHPQSTSSAQGWQGTDKLLAISVLPVEWGVKERFLRSSSAQQTLGDGLGPLRRRASRRVLQAYVAVIRGRSSAWGDRVICARNAMHLFYGLWAGA